jgi:quercetin 2,3-dioxygenase
MLTIRRSADPGRTSTDWLDSRHTFSFGDYHDPEHMNFGPLRVINEDVVAGGGGFPPHDHQDMEIMTYILSGALEHRDSLGTGSVIRPGEIQRMSAGKGIVHSELNASRERPVHLLQIWIVPSEEGLPPSYEQKAIDLQSVANKFARIAAPDPRTNEVRLTQDVEIWAAKLEAGVEAIQPLAPGRRAWLQVAGGEVVVGPHVLRAGDALAVTDEDAVSVRSQAPSELLLFDMA